MKFASRVYTIAGIIGLLEIVPLFFAEDYINRTMPPPITHPDMFYGFLCVTLVWQGLFLMLARDPQRYRPMMIPTMFEKFTYVVAMAILFSQQRVPFDMLPPVAIDLVLGVLFVVSYFRTAERPAQAVQGERTLAS